MDRVNGLLTLDVHQVVNLILDSLFSSSKLRQVGREARYGDLVSQIVLDGVRQYEVAIGQTLHQGRSTQTVGTMVREVALADGEQTLDRGHQFVVHPDTTHGVVDGGIDHHRVVVGADVGNLLVHVEEVAIALSYYVLAQTVDSLREVEEYSQTGIVYAEALVAALFSSTAGYVTRYEVTEGRVATLQVVVAVLFRNILTLQGTFLQLLGILQFLGHPDTTIVTQRL